MPLKVNILFAVDFRSYMQETGNIW